MSSHRRITTAMVGAAAICAAMIGAGVVRADEPSLARECGLTTSSWANGSAVYTGSFYRGYDTVEAQGWHTELVIGDAGSAGLTVSGSKTYEPVGNVEGTAGKEKDQIVSASLVRATNGTYHASTALQSEGVNIELALPPHCSDAGDVVALTGTLLYTDYGDIIRTANYNPTARPLMRGTPAIDTGDENQGR